MSILLEPFGYSYMVNAMWVSALVGATCAFLSAYLMLKGWSLIGDALSHSIVPGVAGAYMEGVTDERDAAELALAVASTLGFVEVLVLNATGMAPEVPSDDVLRRALQPAMEVKGYGRIVKVDSEVVDPPAGRAGGLVRELAPLGITVNTVTPRFAAPSADVAHAVSFVASEAAGSITGQRIVVDGGRGPVR